MGEWQKTWRDKLVGKLVMGGVTAISEYERALGKKAVIWGRSEFGDSVLRDAKKRLAEMESTP
jgi:hypothetical protein